MGLFGDLTPRERLTKARVKLQESKPFFAYLSQSLRFIESEELPTMGVDKFGNCYYNEEFVKALSERELEGTLCHEVMHCLHPDTIVSNCRIKDIKRNDSVIDDDGNIIKVNRVGSRHYNGLMHSIKCRGRLPINITEGHRILTYSEENKEYIWKNSEDVNVNDYLVYPKMKVTKRIEAPMKLNKDLAFILGLFTADGWTTKNERCNQLGFSINRDDKHLVCNTVSKLENLGYNICLTNPKKKGNVTEIKVNDNTLKKIVRKHIGCYSSEKTIPNWIMYNEDIELVKSYLKGLFSGNGWIQNKGCKDECIGYCTINKVLAVRLQQLLSRRDINAYSSLYVRNDGDMKIRGKSYKTKDKYILNSRDENLYKLLGYEYNKTRPIKYYTDTDSAYLVKVTQVDSFRYNGLVYNISTKSENYTANGITVHNCALQHLERQNGKEQELWNVSTDAVINALLLRDGQTLPEGAILPRSDKISILGKELLDVSKKSANEVYDELYDNWKKHKKGRGSGGQGQGKGNDDGNGMPKEFDKHIYRNKGQGGKGKDNKKGQGQDSGKFKPKQQRPVDWEKKLVEASTYAKMQGNLPAGLQRVVDTALGNTIDWRGLLYKYITTILPYDYTWGKPHKKSHSIGVYFPDILREKITIVCDLDTSGSISDRELSEFYGELSGIVSSFENVDLVVIFSDTEVYGGEVLHNPTKDEIMDIKPQGGGGTDHRPVFEWVRENNSSAKLLINFTDGYTSFPEETPEIDTIWVLTGSGRDADSIPFGNVVEMPRMSDD